MTVSVLPPSSSFLVGLTKIATSYNGILCLPFHALYALSINSRMMGVTPFDRCEGHQQMPFGGHQARQAFAVRCRRKILIEPNEIFFGALKRFRALLE